MFGPDGPAVTVRAEGPEPPRVAEVLGRRTERLAYFFAPEAIDDGTPTIDASLAGVPVRLAPRARWPGGVLERLVEHFLYHPALEVPIEPFVALARAVAYGGADGGTTDLRHAYREVLGTDWFVDREGRVSLSERWAKAERFLGDVSDTPEALETSDLGMEVTSYRERVFSGPSPCATCLHFPACGGFWLALGEKDDDACRDWHGAMDRIVEAWRTHRDGAPVLPGHPGSGVFRPPL